MQMNPGQCQLVTKDVLALTRFYEAIIGAKAEVLGGGYVEFQHSPCAGLTITAPSTTRGDSAPGASADRALALDFEVEDVDAHYARLKDDVTDWVFGPRTMPWGRAMLFRDPDGNLINIFASERRSPGT
jgi:predicted enzyme related to lactoylglutathione lyase